MPQINHQVKNREFEIAPQEDKLINFSTIGFNLLHVATYLGNIDTIISLLMVRTDVNVKALGHLNYTPLHFAVKLNENSYDAQVNKANILSVLLTHNQIDVQAKTIYDYTPLGLALICNQYLSVLYLFNSPLILPAIYNDVKNNYDFYIGLILRHNNPFINIEFLKFVSIHKLNTHNRDVPDNVLMNSGNYHQLLSEKISGADVEQLKNFLYAVGYNIDKLIPKKGHDEMSLFSINDHISSDEIDIMGSDNIQE